MHSDALFRVKRRLACLLALSMLIGGCAAPGGSMVRQSSEPKQATESKQPETPIVRPSKPARVTQDDELGLTVTESVQVSADVSSSYSAALHLLQIGETAGGIEALQSVTQKAPELTAPYIDLGIAYTNLGDMEKAEKNLKHALLLTPDHPVAHNELGIVYRRTGRFQLARQSYEQALAISEDYHYAQHNLGVLCDLFLQDLECALTNYQAYQQAFPDDREVEIWIADIRSRMENP